MKSRDSCFSRSKAIILSTISLGMPTSLPLSSSAFVTKSFSVFVKQPIFATTDVIVCQHDWCCL